MAEGASHTGTALIAPLWKGRQPPPGSGPHQPPQRRAEQRGAAGGSRCLPAAAFSEFQTYVGRHEGLYPGYLALSESDDFPGSMMPSARIRNTLRDFRLSGIGLPAEAQQRYGGSGPPLGARLPFPSNNVLDATRAGTSW